MLLQMRTGRQYFVMVVALILRYRPAGEAVLGINPPKHVHTYEFYIYLFMLFDATIVF
jgi:hypothetical protein